MAQRELTREEIEQLLRSQRIVRVAFSVEGRLYLLPLGYVWLDGALHLMTSAGQKTEMAAANGRVAFQVDDSAEHGMIGWSSATGEGEWEIITAKMEQMKIGAVLVARFPELLSWANRETIKKESSAALIFARIKPLWMTGRTFLADE
ncbi:MAG TPA: pyridoxamine 5'-phosphate oxidase family protein [Thermoanaerobaculia bacterium]